MIFRRLPQTIISIYTALRMAFTQNNLVGGNTVLTQATINRLNAIFPLYQQAVQLINQRKSESEAATAAKNKAQKQLKLWLSEFLDSAIKCVRLGIMAASDLSLYGLEAGNPTLPDMDTEQELLTAAEMAMAGEQTRINNGGTPIALPVVADIKTRYDEFVKTLGIRNLAKQALDDAQESAKALNPEAEKVVKKIWDESETFYNEESDESRRANCRPWGVVYISDTRMELRAQALSIDGGKAVPLPEAIITLNATGESDNADENGNLLLKTGYTGSSIVHVECPGFAPQDFTKDFTGDKDLDLGEITLVAL